MHYDAWNHGCVNRALLRAVLQGTHAMEQVTQRAQPPASGRKLVQAIDQAVAELDRWARRLESGDPAGWRQGARIWRELLLMSKDGSAAGVAPSIRRADLTFALKIDMDKRAWTRFERFYGSQMRDRLLTVARASGLPALSAVRLSQRRGGNPDATEAVYYLVAQPEPPEEFAAAPVKMNDRLDPPNASEKQSPQQVSAAPKANEEPVPSFMAEAVAFEDSATGTSPQHPKAETSTRAEMQTGNVAPDAVNGDARSIGTNDRRYESLVFLSSIVGTGSSVAAHSLVAYCTIFLAVSALLAVGSQSATDVGLAAEAARILAACRSVLSGRWGVIF